MESSGCKCKDRGNTGLCAVARMAGRAGGTALVVYSWSRIDFGGGIAGSGAYKSRGSARKEGAHARART
ncbi:hypothetical protein Micbo1qcDRAFT_43134 [Microdochium bolleyi]|uniref:Uncharacterized protein n=1 Tax=Microdochium bolleyi TaxID=196109 RepID=A0A136JAZ8_9PEZI|nr:hypothetical protein Micbo1qcDRAFT_43134 [Microdochium bolleyi]